jgi:hypothetical protein
MSYDLYDMETANLVRSFPTEEAALAMIRQVVERSGPQAVETWVMSRTDLTGEVLEGQALVKRALSTGI